MFGELLTFLCPVEPHTEIQWRRKEVERLAALDVIQNDPNCNNMRTVPQRQRPPTKKNEPNLLLKSTNIEKIWLRSFHAGRVFLLRKKNATEMNKKAKIWGLEFEPVFLPKLSQNTRETPICLKTQPTFKAILAHFDIGRSTLATRNLRQLRQPSWKTCKTYVRKTGWRDVYVAINKMNKNIIYKNQLMDKFIRLSNC